MKQKWSVYAKKADFYGIGEKFNIDPVIARVIRNRDVITHDEIDRYINGDLSMTHDPILMKDMDKGTDIMLEKIKAGKRIRIISDYDVDGVMSGYILYNGLLYVAKTLFENKEGEMHSDEKPDRIISKIDYDIPHRIRDGYGMNVKLVEKAHMVGVDTIITCDNGIAAYAAVAKAKELGMTVIVTDHHEVAYEEDEAGNKIYTLPDADAIIDHKQEECTYPCKELCGAGVAYKFIQLMFRKAGIPETEVEAYVEYLGIATVCDVMNLVDENRIFVRETLRRLKTTKNFGLAALIRNSGRAGADISSFDLGFIIGPCINAAGRLGDAKMSMEFLLENDSYKAEEKSIELINVNNERKDMTVQGTKLAMEMIDEATKIIYPDVSQDVAIPEVSHEYDYVTAFDQVMVLYLPNIHESLVGIIAGRIKEKYYRPVLLFTDSDEDGVLKGSGRSIEGYNMYKELTKVKELFLKYGGHEMAAGFSIKKEDLKALRVALNENAHMDEAVLTPKLMIDVPMPLSYNSIELTNQLSIIEPFGKGNEKPTFACTGITIRKADILGKNRNLLKLKLNMENGGIVYGIYFKPDEFISDIKEWFGDAECVKMESGLNNSVKLDIAYYPDINEFGGRRELQIKITNYRKHVEKV